MAHPYKSKDTEGNKLRAKASRLAGKSGGNNYDPKTAREPRESKMADVPRKASGGSIGMTAGAESGVGRLEKARKY